MGDGSSVSDYDWVGPALKGGKGGIHSVEFPTNLGCSLEDDAEFYQLMKLDHENYVARLGGMGDEGCELSGSTGSMGTFNDSNHPSTTTDEATAEVNDEEGVSDEVPIDGSINIIGESRGTKMVGVDYQMPHKQNMIESVGGLCETNVVGVNIDRGGLKSPDGASRENETMECFDHMLHGDAMAIARGGEKLSDEYRQHQHHQCQQWNEEMGGGGLLTLVCRGSMVSVVPVMWLVRGFLLAVLMGVLSCILMECSMKSGIKRKEGVQPTCPTMNDGVGRLVV